MLPRLGKQQIFWMGNVLVSARIELIFLEVAAVFWI